MNSVWNNSRFRREDNDGFYESYFQRANHPSRPLAFWIRYTVFSPRGRPDETRGELWAIYFDGETSRNIAVKEAIPISDCKFSPTQLDVHIGGATLTNGTLRGRAMSASHALDWTLDYAGHEPPLLLLPEPWYEERNMLKRLKLYIQRFRAGTSLSDKLQLFSFLVGIVALIFVYYQLRENTHTNRVSIRGQLYQSEAGMTADEASDEEQHLTTIWTLVPHTVKDQAFAETLIKLVSDDSTALKAKTAEELYRSMFSVETFADPQRRKATNQLRRLFLYTQTNFYHVHNAHDYWQDGILSEPEWVTWKGLLREMNAHPMLITVIWQGHRNRYFSRAFGKFLQQELCADSVPLGDPDPEGYQRGKEFIRIFYPDMLKKEWLDALPHY